MKKMVIENESPIVAVKQNGGSRAVINGSADMYGACSIENFSSASSLGLTHDDAQGWLDYVTQFTAGNFWFRDAGVQVWQYEETYDNWQDSFGTDAVVAFYHSGHGAMDGNGVFQAPLGSKWDNRDWAFSNAMRLGNETARYLFWSTCFSLRVFAPHNPIRTWHPVNQGFRMLFGFETTSVDNANYGRYFWEEWRKGKAFSTAWLDASWRISHNQVPTVVATGTNAAEALNRLNTERFFNAGPGSNSYYQWRWYNASSAAPVMASLATGMPASPKLAILETDKNFFKDAVTAATALGFAKKNTDNLLYDQSGLVYMKEGTKKVTISKEGQINLELGKHNYENTTQIDQSEAVDIARGVIRECKFDAKSDLQLDRVLHGYSCGGSSKGSGTIGDTTITETIVEFRQIVDGLPAINDDHGLVRVKIDNDGKVTNVSSSRKKIAELSTQTKLASPPEPGKKAGGLKAADWNRENLEGAFALKLNSVLGNANGNAIDPGNQPDGVTLIEEKLGYDLDGGYGNLATQREYEVDLGNGLKKRYKVRVPLYA
jgi:hypothetical protein